MPSDREATKNERELKWAIVDKIEALGYVGEIFTDPRGPRPGKVSLSGPLAWSAPGCEEVMRRCEGCALLGFPRWRFPGSSDALATDYSHYEGGLAYTLGLPLLTLAHQDIDKRVVFDRSFSGTIGFIPPEASKDDWLKSDAFLAPFDYWKDALAQRRDVFLGYCSASSPTAKKVKTYLTNTLKLSVLDWAKDFDPARSIMEQIQDAGDRCGAGIFLFTKDDDLALPTKTAGSAPRDNVVFEAGYFAAAKGKRRVLIILEDGAKMPADLGGDIYAALPNQGNVDAIKPVLKKFAEAL